MEEVKMKVCADNDCENKFRPYRTTDKYCSSSCTYKNHKSSAKLRKTPIQKKQYNIRKRSKKMSAALIEYSRIRKEFFQDSKNKFCRVFSNKEATDIHHKMGKVGFADEWARENNIRLLVDVRFFLPVSREGHDLIENSPIWAKRMGYSINRLANYGKKIQQ